MRASIHIITRDRVNSLAVLLGSLCTQTTKDFDIVILDNGRNVKVGQDHMCGAALRRLQLEGVRVHLVESKAEHRDIGAYRNECVNSDPFNNQIGIRIDDDSLLEPNYIEILVNGFTEPDIGVVGGIVPYIFVPKTYILQPAKFNEITSDYDWVDNCVTFVRFINDDGKDLHYQATYFPSGHIRSSYAYRMDLAKKIRFPEWSGFTGFTEETVFCIKVWMNGYKVLINPNAVAWHYSIPGGGGRDKVVSQAQIDKIKTDNLARLKVELDLYRASVKAERRGYP